MHLFRFLLWVLMAALPLQGTAGASLLHCAGTADHTAAAESHDHRRAHADHEHAVQDDGAADSEPSANSDPMHSCCTVGATARTLAVTVMERVPTGKVHPADIAVRTRFVLLPDKPPRA